MEARYMYHHHRRHHPFTPERYVTFCAYLQRMFNILFESEYQLHILGNVSSTTRYIHTVSKFKQKLGKTTDVRVVIRNVSSFKCFLSRSERGGDKTSTFHK